MSEGTTGTNPPAAATDPKGTAPQAPAGTAPAKSPSKPRGPKTPQPLRIMIKTETGYEETKAQPGDDVTDVNALSAWLKKAELAPGNYVIMRVVGPVKIESVTKPTTKVSIG